MSAAQAIGGSDPDDADDQARCFRENHIKYLQDRAVALDWAAYAGLRAVDAEEGAKLLGFPNRLSSGGLFIPYPNEPGYGRIRLDEGGVRFLAPANREVPVYLPPYFQYEGADPVYVVEGPIKALVLVDQGFNALGLGGTGTTFREKNGVRRPNDSWAKVSIRGRHFVFVFDSNRMTNPNVARDEARATLALEREGANVTIAMLPPREDGQDQGPDDFIAIYGTTEFQKVVAATVPADPVKRAESIVALGAEKERRRAAAALLADLPFLASVKERDVSAEMQVIDILKPYGVTSARLGRAVREMAARLKKNHVENALPSSKYVVHEDRLCMLSKVDETVSYEPLCNFTAQIDREEVLDDGAEQKRVLVFSGKLASGETLHPERVETQELGDGLWPLKHWGPGAIVYPVRQAPGHLLAAIQESSTWTTTSTFTHTGWREHNGEMIFLHADGAVGATNVSVRVDTSLSRYKLPPTAEDIPGAVRLSLSFLGLADARITVPLFCAAFRAPLQHALYCDSTVALAGPTGAMKTSLVALLMGLYGNFDAEHLPASWFSTANRLEQLVFTAKDMLVPIDDFAPIKAESGEDLHRKAAQILRAIGNANSRGRLRADLTARPDRPPRALVLSTGEDVPGGESIQARIFTIRMRPGDVDIKKLTELQASRHRLPHAMLGYIFWLKAQMSKLPLSMEKRFIELRTEMYQHGQHLRAPAAMAHLLLGMEYFCLFATDIGALDTNEAASLLQKTRAALLSNTAEQSHAAVDVNPVHRFISVLRTLLVQGKVMTVDVTLPLDSAEGNGIGWKDKDYFYLLPEAVYSTIVDAMRVAGQAMPLTQRMLWSRLVDDGFIQKGDEEGRATRKKHVGGLQGRRERLLWFPRGKLELHDESANRVNDVPGWKNHGGDDEPIGDGAPGDGPGAGEIGHEGNKGGPGGFGPQFGLRFQVVRSPEPAGLAPACPDAGPQSPVPAVGTVPGAGRACSVPSSSGSEHFQEVARAPGRPEVDGSSQSPEAPLSKGEMFDSGGPQNDVGAGRVDPVPAHGLAPSAESFGASGPCEIPRQTQSALTDEASQNRNASSDPQGSSMRPEASGSRAMAAPQSGPELRDPFAEAVVRAGRVGLVVRSTGPDLDGDGPRLLAVALPNGEMRVFDSLVEAEGFGPLADVLPQVTVIGHDLKLPLAHLRHHLGIELNNVIDTALAWRLLDGGTHLKNNDGYFSLEHAFARAFGKQVEKKVEEKSVDWWGPLRSHVREEAGQEARDVLRLAGAIQMEIAETHLEEVAALEFKLLPVMVDMMLNGVPVDRARWERVVYMSGAEVAALKKNLSATLGVQNVDNNIEVLAALRRLGLELERTNGEALAPYLHLPIVQQLVHYRPMNNFVAGVGRGVLRALDRSCDGRLRAVINPIGATTGRISVKEPNLLGLPRDKSIRSCITAPPGKKLIVGDYNAIELRVLADQTGDEQLKNVFKKKNGDPHRHTASLLMGIPEDQVTDEQRSRAKPINFGGSFGMGKYKLIAYARKNYKVTLTPDEADQFKQKFLQSYSGIAAWQKKMNEEMPVELRTKSGRVSRFFDPDEEYNARLAFPIQGTAADGMKQAMVLLYPHLKKLGAKIILAVHDELLVEAPEEHADTVKELMREYMIAGMQKYVPSVPIVVEPEVRSTWSK